MRKPLALLLLSIVLFFLSSSAQVHLEPFVGYQADLNGSSARLINTGLQLSIRKKKFEFLFQVQKSWLRKSGNSNDSSFSSNAALPLYAPASKTIQPSSLSTAFGIRFKLAGGKTKNSLFLKYYAGFLYQQRAVAYHYAKPDYIILNPDETSHQEGLFISAGIEYARQLNIGRIFFDLNFSTPPIGHSIFSDSNNYLAPVTLNVGYSIKLSKK